MDFILKMTCSACPEQYDVFYKGEQVGYLRLRHGVFTCSYPDVGGETIYEAYPKGDGSFDYDERDFYIGQALEHIKRKIFQKIEYDIEIGD